MKEEQLRAAIQSGLALLDPGQNLLDVYRTHAGGLLVLQQVLVGLAQGHLQIRQAMQTENTPTVPDTPLEPDIVGENDAEDS